MKKHFISLLLAITLINQNNIPPFNLTTYNEYSTFSMQAWYAKAIASMNNYMNTKKDEPISTAAESNPNISNPDIGEPDISKPDIGEPDIGEPDIGEPDIGEPDISKPDISKPDISKPDISKPDISEPDISEPDISKPDIGEPDIGESDDEVDKDENINLTIGIGDSKFSAKLYNNESAKALISKLPMTINMSEMNGNEKYYFMPDNIITDTKHKGQINAGDLMLYGSNCLVLFYESFSTSYSYTELGYIEDITGLVEALGTGNIEITFNVD